MGICDIEECQYHDADIYWRCSKYVDIEECPAIPLIKAREEIKVEPITE